jgi:ATP phosphoribosyltransferase
MSMSPAATPAVRDRLRIAIQKSGRLSEPARALLASAGLSWRESRDRLFCYGESLPVDLLLVRDDDIPGLIAQGVCDLGIVGRNVLLEQAGEREQNGQEPVFREWRALGFGGCRLALAVPEGWDWQGPVQLAGKRIATTYPYLLRSWLRAQQVDADIVVLSGSVEIAPRLGQADAVCDLVSSGATLAANQLKPVLDILHSEAVLAGPVQPFGDVRAELADMLLRRIDGVLRIRDSKLLLFQAPRAALPQVLQLLPDAEPPTMCPVEGSDMLALQALCHGAMTWQRLEELKRVGARGLMVLPVERVLA